MNPRVIVAIALWVVAVLAMAAGWIILVVTDAVGDVDGGQAVFVTLAALCAPALCTALLRRHPDEWSGPLVGVCVLAALLAGSRAAPLGVMSQLTGVLALVTVLLPAVVALNHPALHRPLARTGIIMRCWWITVAAGAVIGVIALSGEAVPSQWWDTEDPGAPAPVATILFTGWAVVVVFAAGATIVAALTRYRSMPGGGRAALRPLVVPLVAWAVATVVTTGWIFIHGMTDPSADLSEDPAASVFALLPPLLVGALAAGIGWIDIMVRRPTVQAGSAALAHHDRRRGRETYVEQYLSRALADPSIQVLYPIQPMPDAGEPEWVDSRGRVVRVDVTSPERAVTLIRRGSTLIGLIEQDAAVTARPDAVELVATGAGLIMETEGLMAAARSDLEQSRQLASRLLSASDQPRAELRAQLLDGPLGELTTARTDLAAGTPLAEIVHRLNGIATQVRTISHGVFPTALSSGGLAAVIPEVGVPNRRYPAVIEMTAYLAARWDRSASIVETVVDNEPAVRILCDLTPSDAVRDRVAALGGQVEPVATRWSITVPSGE